MAGIVRSLSALCCLAAFALVAPLALAEGCKVENGADYSFERSFAVRKVKDSHDRGTIRLATFIYRPLKDDRHQVVLFSHGSTNGQTVDPHEPMALVPCSLKNYFLTRGYTLVTPMRRGRGESTGRFVEECARHADPGCSPASNRNASDRALAEAVADSRAVLDQLVFGKLVPRGGKVILVGHSRGGFLALALAAARPTDIAAVINFSGGWLGFQPALLEGDEGRLRQAWHAERLRRFGAAFHGPTLWLYAPNDPLYGEATTRGFHRAFAETGGVSDYLAVAGEQLENGHLLIQESPLWAAAADGFLAAVDGRQDGAR